MVCGRRQDSASFCLDGTFVKGCCYESRAWIGGGSVFRSRRRFVDLDRQCRSSGARSSGLCLLGLLWLRLLRIFLRWMLRLPRAPTLPRVLRLPELLRLQWRICVPGLQRRPRLQWYDARPQRSAADSAACSSCARAERGRSSFQSQGSCLAKGRLTPHAFAI